jgi:hypothetical protein
MKKAAYRTVVFLLFGISPISYAQSTTAECQQQYGQNYAYNQQSGACVQRIIINSGNTAANNSDSNAFCKGGACTYVPLEPLPTLPGCYGPNPPANCVNPSTQSFASAMPSIFKLLIGAGALVAIIMIVLGALTYMFSDIAGNKSKALNRIRSAMWAIVLFLSSYLILYTLNPDLVMFKLDLGATGNFDASPAAPGTVLPQQMTQAQLQAQQNACANGGKSARFGPDGSLICQ